MLRKGCGLATALISKSKGGHKGWGKEVSAYEMELQISRGVAPKYRRQFFHGERKRAIGEILRKSCARKRVSIVEEECCPDHIHYVAWDAAQDEVSAFIGYLKERAARWYISSSVSWIQISQSGVLVPRLLCRHSGKNTTKITEYIRHQLVRINSENGWASRIPEAGLRTAGNSDADSCRARLVEVL